MVDNYVIETISDEEKQRLLNDAQQAIANLRKKIAELQQMISDNIGMPAMNASHEVAFYIKDIIGIPNRESQKDVTGGAVDESYYIRFIPINNINIVIDLRVSDHIRGEEWSDRRDDGVHPNIRAGVIVQDTGKTTPNASVRKPHKVNGCKVKRFLQQVPTTVYGTPENVIKHLNTLICLFQNGKFGKYKNKQRLNSNTNMKTENRNVVRLTESKLKQIIAEELKKALMKEVESYSAEEMRDKWKKDGNLYNDAYPTSNGDDLYTLGSYNNKVEPIYFSNKADAMDWIKTYVTDPQSIQALKDALSQYRLHDPNSDSLGKRRINQVSSNLDTHRRRQSF